ncbi:aldehyde dehydrogenase family protein [Leisingera aquaemixtae]|uniref:aldehyde dehydrogenase family protein n=1 Tax=Leisingera aquaemixtae TaxID=1396826 RepID=UPI0021A6AC6E|nr:aldehyde dehydrogenase family protein [Leisingera aquaemixtae]
MPHSAILAAAGLTQAELTGGSLSVTTPVDGSEIARLKTHSMAEAEAQIAAAKAAFKSWRLVRPRAAASWCAFWARNCAAKRKTWAASSPWNAARSTRRVVGEVQEMIDICDFAVGLSRPLYGLTIASERPGHAMRETWHPMGTCGIITAFNFPVAPWCWNAALALVCGDPVIWKPSEKTPLTALAVQKICDRAMAAFGGDAPEGLIQVLIGERDLGEVLTASKDVAIISATGSVPMGKAVSADMSKRLGRTILELGVQQRDDRRTLRRSGNGPARHRVLRRRHRRPALHLPAPPDRS